VRLVIVESPYAGQTVEETQRNLRYLRACLHDCFQRGEVPFASHAIYTQPGVLDDHDAAQRELGIQGGFLWRSKADATVVYVDLGMSRGMKYGIEAADRVRKASESGHPIEERWLGEDWDKPAFDGSRWGLPFGVAP
jgi:hypothetical protein